MQEDTIEPQRTPGPTPSSAHTLYTGPTAEDLAHIPPPLTALSQWVLWRGEDRVHEQTGEIKLNKVPIDPQTLRNADTTDPATWGTFAESVAALPVALEEWEEEDPAGFRGGGLGFVFSDADPYCGIDFDHCIDPATGGVAAWAQAHVDALTSYTEVSPTETGLHVIVEGDLPPRGRKRGQVEMYTYARFFTMTGRHISTTPETVEHRQPQLDALWALYFGARVGNTVWCLDTQQNRTNHNGLPWAITALVAAPDGTPYAQFAETSTGWPLTQCEPAPMLTGQTTTPLLGDDTITTKAEAAKNGAKFARLWAGDTSMHQDDDSSADMALCCMLAFWTQDPAQLDRLFRQSGLMRAKWDEKHGQQTYGARTVREALARQTEHYTPHAGMHLLAHAAQNGSTPGTGPVWGGTPALDLPAWLALIEALPAAERLAAVLADMESLATQPLAVWLQAKKAIKALDPTCNLNDLERLRTETQKALQRQQQTHARAALPDWQRHLLCNKAQEPQQTLRNFVLAIQHLEPWKSATCWYDMVRERHMVGDKPVEDGDDTAAGVIIEEAIGIRITNVPLVGRALDYVCRQSMRDLLREWVDALPTVKVTNALTTWLRTLANVSDLVPDAYVADVSRITLVGIIARIMDPGCQYRCVPILEGAEDIGKSQLTKVLAGQDPYGQSWHVALSAGMEGKEAHMMLDGALIAELEELSSYSKTDENRMKALVTMQTDSFVPKFSNKRVDHPRRTIFIATVNPEGAEEYLKGQSGNTRYLPIKIGTVNLARLRAQRTQLFAEAKAYYLAHAKDWWRLECAADAANEREARRQTSVYESEALRLWLAPRKECTWHEVAEQHLGMSKDKLTKAISMEIAKALRAFQWVPERSGERRYWVRA